jgi:hypothetical protein
VRHLNAGPPHLLRCLPIAFVQHAPFLLQPIDRLAKLLTDCQQNHCATLADRGVFLCSSIFAHDPFCQTEHASSDRDVGYAVRQPVLCFGGIIAEKGGLAMRFTKSLRATCLATILFCAIGCLAQLSNPSSNSNLSRKPQDIHCAAGVCTANIDPASFFPNVQSGLTHRGVNLSRPLLLRNPGKWEGALSGGLYTMRSYLMARRIGIPIPLDKWVIVCEPSSIFDERNC